MDVEHRLFTLFDRLPTDRSSIFLGGNAFGNVLTQPKCMFAWTRTSACNWAILSWIVCYWISCIPSKMMEIECLFSTFKPERLFSRPFGHWPANITVFAWHLFSNETAFVVILPWTFTYVRVISAESKLLVNTGNGCLHFGLWSKLVLCERGVLGYIEGILFASYLLVQQLTPLLARWPFIGAAILRDHNVHRNTPNTAALRPHMSCVRFDMLRTRSWCEQEY